MNRGFFRNRDGAAALETALVAPIFLTLVLVIFNAGWALYCGGEVRHAVERSTRLLIADPTTDEAAIEADVHGALHSADPDDVAVTLTSETVGVDGEIARLSWTYSYTVDAPFVAPVVFNFDSSIVVPLREVESSPGGEQERGGGRLSTAPVISGAEGTWPGPPPRRPTSNAARVPAARRSK